MEKSETDNSNLIVSNINEREFQSVKKVNEFFKCLICFSKVKNPLMCPHCTKFCCAGCFSQWLDEHQSSCPSCRRNLWPDQLIPLRFMNEWKEVRFF